jgi:hypothetical protein
MVKDPTYRIRVRFFDLTGRGAQGVPQFPLKCWRATWILNGASGDTVLDGARFGQVCDPGALAPNPVSFTVGGVFMPDGSPAILDQRMLLGRSANFSGIVVCEYLEPL